MFVGISNILNKSLQSVQRVSVKHMHHSAAFPLITVRCQIHTGHWKWGHSCTAEVLQRNIDCIVKFYLTTQPGRVTLHHFSLGGLQARAAFFSRNKKKEKKGRHTAFCLELVFVASCRNKGNMLLIKSVQLSGYTQSQSWNARQVTSNVT